MSDFKKRIWLYVMKKQFKRSGKFYVYIVECQDGTYYAGYTNDLMKRINEHNSNCGRGAKYLRGKTPVKLAYAKEYNYYRNAVRAERDIKKRTRMEKEAMIRAYTKSADKLAPQICCANLSGGLTAKRLSVYIKTFGCQMNLRDSEVICGLLEKEGYKITDEPKEAGIILFNTCSVRQHAEDKVWSEIGRLGKMAPLDLLRKSKKGGDYANKKIIGVIGCMAQNYKEAVFERSSNVDFAVGPSDIAKIPQILNRLIDEKKKNKTGLLELKIWETGSENRPEEIYHTDFHQEKDHTYVVISEGCSNYCSYCVVPYVRGDLRHRHHKDILKEIEKGIAAGITKITLLGQNVNAYKDDSVDFVRLLEFVNSINGLKEFSFITSHPKDTSVELFKAMQDLEKVKKYLHLPVQSGSDRILKLMNRSYSGKYYFDLIESYRKIVEGAVLTTDIIVGFPGETEQDFQETYDLVKDAEFNAAFIFKYSTRPHTAASNMEDSVPKEEKERRHRLILDLQKGISKQKNECKI